MKLELNVKRFNNEDVIATSSKLCKHGGSHIYYDGVSTVVASYSCYDGEFHLENPYIIGQSEVPTTPSQGAGWYYFGTDELYHYCEDQSSEAHPVED